MTLNVLKKLHKNGRSEIERLKALLDTNDITIQERRSLAAKIGGVHRRYRQVLIIEITAWALRTDNSPASKYKIQQWQESVFGHSISNNALAVWCKEDRGSGERIKLDISEGTTDMAKQLWQTYVDALKFSEIRLDPDLKGKMLSADLGL
jgi:hypothetical protein